MPNDTCLYFPHIEVRDQSWIRSYVLFWDEIRTIVPDAVEDPYQLEDLEVLSGEGILLPERLSTYPNEVRAASNAFLEHWDRIEESFRFSSSHINIAKDYDDYHFMHSEKMTDKLMRKFREHVKGDFLGHGEMFTYRGTAEWEVTDPKMATAYMALLANEIAGATKRDPVTNYPMLRVPHPKLLQPSQTEKDGFEPRLLEIVMENIVIDPKISIRKIIAFKKQNQALFNDFRHELSGMRAHVEAGYSRSDLVTLFNRRIKPKMETLRGSLSKSHLHWVGGGCLTIPAVPDSAAAVAELFGTTGDFALAATFGLVLTGVSLGAHHTSRSNLKGEPLSYLSSIEKKFSLPMWER